jgi:hypothetical protein|tara:strand:+ start:1507 stop:1701 length:195 start_codon:yes stop_codon:yes gene_type:complete
MKSKPKQKKSEKQIVSDFNKKYNKDAYDNGLVKDGSGKGDGPRNIFSDDYRKNYDAIFRKNPKD